MEASPSQSESGRTRYRNFDWPPRPTEQKHGGRKRRARGRWQPGGASRDFDVVRKRTGSRAHARCAGHGGQRRVQRLGTGRRVDLVRRGAAPARLLVVERHRALQLGAVLAFLPESHG